MINSPTRPLRGCLKGCTFQSLLMSNIRIHKPHMIELSRLPYPSNLLSNILRGRIDKGHASRSIEFLAMADSEEAGLLSYEDHSDKRLGFIYEIFVLPSFRNRGIGTYLLSQAEQYAIQLNCKVSRLKPYALDHETNPDRLMAWYTKMGYIPITDDQEHLQKQLRTRGSAY